MIGYYMLLFPAQLAPGGYIERILVGDREVPLDSCRKLYDERGNLCYAVPATHADDTFHLSYQLVAEPISMKGHRNA